MTNTFSKRTLPFLALVSFSLACSAGLFEDLTLVDQIDKELKDELPFFYNYSFMGGYFNTPSARMPKEGVVSLGGASVSPYNIYGLNFQMFTRLELSANYRVFRGLPDEALGSQGFGDMADRIANFKLGVLTPEDGLSFFPQVSIGAEDFFSGKFFHSQYIILTKQFLPCNLELSLGWAKGRMKGFFGAAAWTPFRKNCWFLKDFSLIAEYDPTDYKHSSREHLKGRSSKGPFNGGMSWGFWDLLQLSVSTIRGGEKVAASGSLKYPIGTTKGLFPKTSDPTLYSSPVDTEPLGVHRKDKEFASELVYAFADQGLDLYTIYLTGAKELWLKVINNRYRQESVVRDRMERILAALLPSDISSVTVTVEATALPCQSYHFRAEDLRRYQHQSISLLELETLSPMREATTHPRGDAQLLFQRKKAIWSFLVHPRLITFFGSAQGKFKYNIGMIAAPDGYLFDEIYYKFQFGYSIKSSMYKLSASDKINPSHLFNVRTDTIRYYQSNSVALEEAYAQKSWNLGKGFFARFSFGYFEPAYGGLAAEALWYPANSLWAVGVEGASLLKRRYKGIAFTKKARKVEHGQGVLKHFIGDQYFLDIYYAFKPLNLEFKISVGQFLAKDFGMRTEMVRCFESGLRVMLWYTVTNGHDKVNGSTYFDKGVAIFLPFDLFLKQSSRNYLGYGMSAWLRDVGARADTGKQLFNILYEERACP